MKLLVVCLNIFSQVIETLVTTSNVFSSMQILFLPPPVLLCSSSSVYSVPECWEDIGIKLS